MRLLLDIPWQEPLLWLGLLAVVLGACVLARRRAPQKSHAPIDEISALLSELQTLSSSITTELDARTAKLQSLLTEADQKIATLQSARHAGSECTHEEADHSVEDHPDPRHLDIYTLADEGRTSREIA